jgi:DNA-binding MarR family transcriptional regulator
MVTRSSSEEVAMKDVGADSDITSLSIELRTVVGRLSRRLRAELAIADLTLVQASVISALDHHGAMTISELARVENVRPQSVHAIVGSLEAAGMVYRQPHQTDGRKMLVELTERGQAALQTLRSARETWLGTVLRSGLTARDLRKLRDIMPILERISRS